MSIVKGLFCSYVFFIHSFPALFLTSLTTQLWSYIVSVLLAKFLFVHIESVILLLQLRLLYIVAEAPAASDF